MSGIGWAIKHLNNGERVRRAGWNGKGMWLALIRPPHIDREPVQDGFEYMVTVRRDPGVEGGYTMLPWVGMKTAAREFVPWLCSQTDLLATDWELAE